MVYSREYGELRSPIRAEYPGTELLPGSQRSLTQGLAAESSPLQKPTSQS